MSLSLVDFVLRRPEVVQHRVVHRHPKSSLPWLPLPCLLSKMTATPLTRAQGPLAQGLGAFHGLGVVVWGKNALWSSRHSAAELRLHRHTAPWPGLRPAGRRQAPPLHQRRDRALFHSASLSAAARPARADRRPRAARARANPL